MRNFSLSPHNILLISSYKYKKYACVYIVIKIYLLASLCQEKTNKAVVYFDKI